MVSPDLAFHCQTRFSNSSRPRSRQLMPSFSSWRMTTIWVAMPAWSVPGSQRVLSPSMRCQRTVTSICVCSSMWPMWSEPVTLGGGMTSEKYAPGARDGTEDAGVDPPLRPMRLEPLRLVHFIDLHGKGEEKSYFSVRVNMLTSAGSSAERTSCQTAGNSRKAPITVANTASGSSASRMYRSSVSAPADSDCGSLSSTISPGSFGIFIKFTVLSFRGVRGPPPPNTIVPREAKGSRSGGFVSV